MRISHAGLDAIKHHEGLRLGLSPSRSITNFVDDRRADAKTSGKRWRCCSLGQRLADVSNLVSRQLAAGVSGATQVDKTVAPLKLGIGRQRHPFKILGPVVCLPTVDVVDAQCLVKPAAKGGRNESVNKKLGTNRTCLHGHHHVALPRNVWRKDAPAAHLRWPAHNSRFSAPVASPDATSITYLDVRRGEWRLPPFFMYVHTEIVL